MKTIASTVILTLLMSAMAAAGPGQVGSATEPNALIGDYEVLLNQKHDLEVKLSKDASDYAAYKALVENTLVRQQMMNRRYQVGMTGADSVALVQAEVVGLSVSCPVLSAQALKLFNVGLRTRTQVETIQSACEMLPTR
ncbi:hypothetical protein DOM22_19115 [Bdellovibrio sp. ZAP7]|uniref:hypothetical protein n=1 Tax=Bdellovibrio sp. ZAP7 TaxID=2231053 RepID=UPI0011575A08|nr:hypothetical protein [Bdellovibrio sp. ZAP7]QDK47123.1 hypothetical protein DOM22_19115 [Bdellovibrio sp. ZAP7]